MVPRLWSEREYKGGVIMLPGNNDISNLSMVERQEQLDIAKKSVCNMVDVAKRAFMDNYSLEKLVLLEYPPRADSVQL